MRYNDFIKHFKKRDNISRLDIPIASKILNEFILKTGYDYELISMDELEELLYLYFSIKGTDEEKILNDILNNYHFDYSMSIRNALYYLLATPKEFTRGIDPLSWPGIYKIEKDNPKYILDTILGKIVVYKASTLFQDTPISYVFDKELMGHCYERSYDVMKIDRSYHAILSHMPNFFKGGHYHAYLENENSILDMASNAFYESKEFADKILCGEIIAKPTYSQVEHKINALKGKIKEVEKNPKLLTLTVYYDIKKHHK